MTATHTDCNAAINAATADAKAAALALDAAVLAHTDAVLAQASSGDGHATVLAANAVRRAERAHIEAVRRYRLALQIGACDADHAVA